MNKIMKSCPTAAKKPSHKKLVVSIGARSKDRQNISHLPLTWKIFQARSVSDERGGGMRHPVALLPPGGEYRAETRWYWNVFSGIDKYFFDF